MFVLETIVTMLGIAGSALTVAAVFLGVPWALYTLARVRRTADETLRVQRDILRELRRIRSGELPEGLPSDEIAEPPKQSWW